MNFNLNWKPGSQLGWVIVSLMLTALLAGCMHLKAPPAAAPDVVGVVVDLEAPRKAALASFLAGKYKVAEHEVRAYVELAWREASKHPNVTPELILAVIQKESSLRAHVENDYGAKGLMQVVPRWHPEKIHANESLLDAAVNIRVGAQILQEYISKKNGNLERALVKYSGNARGYAAFVLREAKALQKI